MEEEELTANFSLDYGDNLTEGLCPDISEENGFYLNITRFWLEGVLMSVLCIVGTVTNTFSIIILSRNELCNTFNQLLICLALVDILYLLFMFTASLGEVFEVIPDFYTLLTPYFIHPFRAITMTASVLMMISIATERYVAVFYPFSRLPKPIEDVAEVRRRRLFYHIFPVMILSFVFNVPKFLDSKLVGSGQSHGPGWRLVITELRLNSSYLYFNAWLRMIFVGVGPLVLVSVLNYKIHRAVRIARSGLFRRSADQPTRGCEMLVMTANRTADATSGRVLKRRPSEGGSEDRLSFMLLVIVLVFLFCNIPRCIILIHDVVILDTVRVCVEEGRVGHGFPVWNMLLGYISHVLLVLNPTANFLVYCAIGRQFRIATKSMLWKLVRRNTAGSHMSRHSHFGSLRTTVSRVSRTRLPTMEIVDESFQPT